MKDLCMVAAFGLEDPLREGVADCIGKLAEGGINVRIFSGDHLYTAIWAAEKAGILAEGEHK
jgi:P-type E1-E2 ATPase